MTQLKKKRTLETDLRCGTQEKDREGELYSKYLNWYLSAAKNTWEKKLHEKFKEIPGKSFAR